jgi:carbon monoxide dehydrogenase subunit G
MPPASFRHETNTDAPLSHVWQRLQDPDVWATVAGVDGTGDHVFSGDNLTGFRFKANVAGVPYRGTARVTQSVAAEAMTLSIRSSELQGMIGVALSAADPGTRLDVSMTMRPAGLLGPMMFPAITRAVQEGFADSVEHLAVKLADRR